MSARRRPIAAQARNREFFAQSRRRFRCAPVKPVGVPAQVISPERHRETHRAVARRGKAPQSRRPYSLRAVKPVGALAQVISPERHRGTHRAVVWLGQAPQSRPAFVTRQSSRSKRLRRPFLSGIAECTGRSLGAVKRRNRAPHSLRADQAGRSARAGLSLSGIAERTGRSLIAAKRRNRAPLSLRAGQAY